MLRAGLDLDERAAGAGLCLALRRAVPPRRRARASSAMSELDESALQMPPDWPLDEAGQGGRDPQRCGQVVACDELLGQARRNDQDRCR